MKIIEVEMINSKGELELVEFHVRDIQSRWKFAETMSRCLNMANGDSFKYSVLMAEANLPGLIINHNFNPHKKDDVNWKTKDLIEEFFANDPEVLVGLITAIVGFTQVKRSSIMTEKQQ